MGEADEGLQQLSASLKAAEAQAQALSKRVHALEAQAAEAARTAESHAARLAQQLTAKDAEAAELKRQLAAAAGENTRLGEQVTFPSCGEPEPVTRIDLASISACPSAGCGGGGGQASVFAGRPEGSPSGEGVPLLCPVSSLDTVQWCCRANGGWAWVHR